jgi:hypothetical protein
MNAPGTRLAVGEARLRQLVLDVATSPERWLALVRYDADHRWYQRLGWDEDHEVWLLSWLPGQRTGFHDHGSSGGACTGSGRPRRPRPSVAGRCLSTSARRASEPRRVSFRGRCTSSATSWNGGSTPAASRGCRRQPATASA